MGDMAGFYMEQELFNWDDPFTILSDTPNYKPHRETSACTWMVKDGTIVQIKDMETSHIQNAMRMMEKASNTHWIAYATMEKELKSRVTTIGSKNAKEPKNTN